MNWSSKDRAIFEYASFDDGSMRFADPLQIRRRLLSRSGGMIDELIEKYNIARDAGSKLSTGEIKEAHPGIFVEGDEAEQEIVNAVVYAFDLTPFSTMDGTGVTSEYCLKLISAFNEWQDQKKTNGVSMPVSPPDMGSLPEHLRSHTMRMSDLSGISNE